jgi:ABC-type transport system involved in multi-copper enzyme maturation permease subunit
MNNIWTISKLTFREAFSRKIFLFFAGISTFILLVFLAIFLFTDGAALFGSVKINGKDLSGSNPAVAAIKLFILNPLYGLGLFLAIFSSASFIPHMLEKGNIDLLLSKPVSRAQIILGKFFGGTAMVFVNVAYLVIGIWFLIGIKFGDWEPAFLLTILTITFAFAILYALIILIGIITKSSVMSMVVSYLIFFIFSPIIANRESIISFVGGGVVGFILEFLHYIVPQTSELSTITSDLAAGNSLLSTEPIFTSLILLVVFLLISISIFKKKDY